MNPQYKFQIRYIKLVLTVEYQEYHMCVALVFEIGFSTNSIDKAIIFMLSLEIKISFPVELTEIYNGN